MSQSDLHVEVAEYKLCGVGLYLCRIGQYAREQKKPGCRHLAAGYGLIVAVLVCRS